MNIRQQQVIDYFLKPIQEKVKAPGERNWELLVLGMPTDLPPDELKYLAETFLNDYSGSKYPDKKKLRYHLENHIQKKELSRRQTKVFKTEPEYEIRDGIRYKDGQPLLCDLPKNERLEVIKRVGRKYPVGGRLIMGLLGKEEA